MPHFYVSSVAAITKAGVVTNTLFTGSPRKYTVVFGIPFLDDSYTVSIVGADRRSWTYEFRTADGFVINSGSSIALTGEVSWQAIQVGEF